MKIVQATIKDNTELAKLFDGYRVFYKQPSNIAVAQQFIDDRLNQQDSTIFIVKNADEAIGFVQLYPIFSSVNASKSLLLNDLFVAPHARKLGAGKALMNQAKTFADEQDACWLMLQTEKTNSQAQKLYESLGYQRDQDCYYYYL